MRGAKILLFELFYYIYTSGQLQIHEFSNESTQDKTSPNGRSGAVDRETHTKLRPKPA